MSDLIQATHVTIICFLFFYLLETQYDPCHKLFDIYELDGH
jgi:hypothetical protein